VKHSKQRNEKDRQSQAGQKKNHTTNAVFVGPKSGSHPANKMSPAKKKCGNAPEEILIPRKSKPPDVTTSNLLMFFVKINKRKKRNYFLERGSHRCF